MEHPVIRGMMHMFAVQGPIVGVVGMRVVIVYRDMMGYIIMDIIIHIITHVTTTIMSHRIMHHHPTMITITTITILTLVQSTLMSVELVY